MPTLVDKNSISFSLSGHPSIILCLLISKESQKGKSLKFLQRLFFINFSHCLLRNDLSGKENLYFQRKLILVIFSWLNPKPPCNTLSSSFSYFYFLFFFFVSGWFLSQWMGNVLQFVFGIEKVCWTKFDLKWLLSLKIKFFGWDFSSKLETHVFSRDFYVISQLSSSNLLPYILINFSFLTNGAAAEMRATYAHPEALQEPSVISTQPSSPVFWLIFFFKCM